MPRWWDGKDREDREKRRVGGREEELRRREGGWSRERTDADGSGWAVGGKEGGVCGSKKWVR